MRAPGEGLLGKPPWEEARTCLVPDMAGFTMDPLQDTAEPISEARGTSEKTYLKKHKRYQTDIEVGSQRNEKEQREHLGQRRKRCHGREKPLQPIEDPCWSSRKL